MTTEARSWTNAGKGPGAKAQRWPPDAGKGKEIDSPLEPPEGTSPADTLTLA